MNKLQNQQNIQHFHLNLGQTFKLKPTDPTDTSCLWKYLLPDFNIYKTRIFIIRDASYTIQWEGDLYPNIIKIIDQNVQGMLDQHGQNSSTIAFLQIRQISPLIHEGIVKNLITYDLRQPVGWKLSNLQYLNLALKYDNNSNKIILPLQNPLSMTCQLITRKITNSTSSTGPVGIKIRSQAS